MPRDKVRWQDIVLNHGPQYEQIVDWLATLPQVGRASTKSSCTINGKRTFEFLERQLNWLSDKTE